MKIVAINGSPKGKNGSTNVIVSAFLKGAQEAGAEIINIFLAEKDIKHCKGCLSCFINSPGCVIKDDMAEILSLEEGADILLLATPLHFDNISSMLKVYMDRRMVLVAPHVKKDSNGESRHVKKDRVDSPFSSGVTPPRLMMIASCGYPERSHFQVISHWVKRLSLNMLTEVIEEIYATQGLFLSAPVELLQPYIANCPQLLDNVAKYLQLLEKAGKEIVTSNRLSEVTHKKLIEQKFVPDEINIQVGNFLADSLPQK